MKDVEISQLQGISESWKENWPPWQSKIESGPAAKHALFGACPRREARGFNLSFSPMAWAQVPPVSEDTPFSSHGGRVDGCAGASPGRRGKEGGVTLGWVNIEVTNKGRKSMLKIPLCKASSLKAVVDGASGCGGWLETKEPLASILAASNGRPWWRGFRSRCPVFHRVFSQLGLCN